MGDLLFAVEKADLSRDVALFADRQRLFNPAPLGAKEDKLHVARFIVCVNPMGNVLPAARRRLMAVDMQKKGNDLIEIGLGNADLATPVDRSGGNVHQDVEDDRFLPLGCAEKAGEERSQLVAHAFDGVERTEQGLE